MRILITQGRVIDPTQNLNQIADLYIAHGKMVSIDKAPDGFQPDQIVSAHNHLVVPGLVDLYAHLNDSYGSVKLHEAAIAAKRGFTTLFCAPDGKMIRDSITRVERFLESDVSYIDVLPIGALSEHLKGNAMSDLTALHAAGCCVFSNGIYPIQDLNFIRNLYLYAASFHLKVVIFPIEHSLARGIMHEGEVSMLNGLAGIPDTAETIAIAQHLLLIEETGVNAHFTHITSAKGVELIKAAKKQGLPITADCTMHHLHLSDQDLCHFNPNAYVYPPIRSIEDRDALRLAVADGTLDAICSSHQPLSSLEKNAPLKETTPGVSTLDTFLSLGLELVNNKILSINTLVEKIACQPMQIYLNKKHSLAPGSEADLCVINPEKEWLVERSAFLSQGRNSPFLGWKLPGEVRYTLKRGKIIHSAMSQTS